MSMAEGNPNPKKRKSWFVRLTLGFFGLVAALFVIVMIGSALMGAAPMFSAVSRLVVTVKPFFYFAHGVLIFLLWWYWAAVVESLSARGSITPVKKSALLRGRNQVILMLVAIEVFVVIGFPFRYIDFS
jgi:hypothetical protein